MALGTDIRIRPVHYFLVPSGTQRASKLQPGVDYLIGRSPDCQIVIANMLVSRQHARLVWQVERGWHIASMGSNGTLVNSVAVANGELRLLADRDEILIAGMGLRFYAIPYTCDIRDILPQTEQPLGHNVTLDVDDNTPPRQRPSLSGGLNTVPLTVLIAYLAETHQDGILIIDRNQDYAIAVRDGRIIDALAGARQGMAALTHLALHGTCFEFFPHLTPPEVTQESLFGPTETIIQRLNDALDQAALPHATPIR
jgi:pSer/pThr/pTyr-binding forkhead associated (FHA) protein